MPEGDALHRAAQRLQVLEGEVVAVETPHPRAAVLRLAERLDGRRLERVQAVGKNLVLGFEGGLVLRSHLRSRGRWRVQAAGTEPFGTPWLVLRGRERQAVLWNGPVLELTRGRSPTVARLGPDVMADPPDLDGMLARLRGGDQGREVGDALLDQRLVAGVGNMWKAEALFAAAISPWRRLSELSDEQLRDLLATAARLMQGPRGRHRVYRRAGRPCPRCGTLVRSYPQGDDARTAYWCPRCQAGTEPAGA
ncbi:MAG: DNA-formamidopyrimidine glycosylase family protein [Gaiellaceae bacterium]